MRFCLLLEARPPSPGTWIDHIEGLWLRYSLTADVGIYEPKAVVPEAAPPGKDAVRVQVCVCH